MADTHRAAEHDVIERTTPQWSPEQSVEHGHEGADINFRSVAGWFIGLAVVSGIFQLLLLLAFGLWSVHAERKDVVPSRVFAVRLPPPPPRVLPNPADSPPGSPLPLKGPAELLQELRRQEDRKLRDYGLEDPQTGRPALPERSVAAVLQQTGGAPAGGARPEQPDTALDEPMPSYPSGGTALENRLR